MSDKAESGQAESTPDSDAATPPAKSTAIAGAAVETTSLLVALAGDSNAVRQRERARGPSSSPAHKQSEAKERATAPPASVSPKAMAPKTITCGNTKKQKTAKVAAVPAPKAAPPVQPEAKYTPILVTLKDSKTALSLFKDLQQRHPGVLANKTAELRPFVGPDQTSWVALLAVPAVTKEQAEAICSGMGSEGKRSDAK